LSNFVANAAIERLSDLRVGPLMLHYHDKGKHIAKATPALSWADVAQKGQTRDSKEMDDPHSSYEI
jgi:hypothetical protein